jgi:hypothetical protein
LGDGVFFAADTEVQAVGVFVLPNYKLYLTFLNACEALQRRDKTVFRILKIRKEILLPNMPAN